MHSRCFTSRRSESIFRRSLNCSVDPTNKQSSITQTTALDRSEGLDNEYHTAVGDVKVSKGSLSWSTFFFLRRPGSDARPHLFWWFASQTHSESLGNVSDVTMTARPSGAVRGDTRNTGTMFLLCTRSVGRPRQEFRQQKANKVSVVKQGSPTFPAS